MLINLSNLGKAYRFINDAISNRSVIYSDVQNYLSVAITIRVFDYFSFGVFVSGVYFYFYIFVS